MHAKAKNRANQDKPKPNNLSSSNLLGPIPYTGKDQGNETTKADYRF